MAHLPEIPAWEAPKIGNFADLIAPIGEADFFATYHDRRPLHITGGAADRFSQIMSWDILTQLLNMTSVWTEDTLQLVLDKVPVPREAYCGEGVGKRAGGQLQPIAEQVKSWLRRGASLVANDIDTLWPGMSAAFDLIEKRLGAKVQSNLYCSWAKHQAFEAHFDTHEVFALHIEGEKTWRVYRGRTDQPIAHDSFRALTKEFHDANRGEVMLEVTLRPGDILYIPRGYYHDALADSPSIHLACGITYPIGVDIVGILHQHTFSHPAFRANLPLADAGDQALRDHIADLARRVADIAKSDHFHRDIQRFRDTFGYQRGGFDLPADALDQEYIVHGSGLSIAQHDGKHILRGAKGAVTIPDGIENVVAWMLARPDFLESEYNAVFSEMASGQRQQALASMVSMKVVAGTKR
ncbi:MAG: cupin domain-containing protein [Alphaproteobacteria bacterium]